MIWLLIWSVTRKPNQIVTELFIRGRKLNTSQVVIIHFYFKVPKDNKLNYTQLFYKNFRQSKSSINTDFINISKECAAKPYCF